MNPARPVLNQVNIVCGDVGASLAFYRRLGVDIPTERVWQTQSGAHHASATDHSGESRFDLDSTAFAQAWNAGWSGRTDLRGRIVVGFGVGSREAVDAIYAEMIGEGYAGLQPPIDAFWGARYAVIEDPDGIAVGIMSPASPEMRSTPPDV